MNNFLQSEKGAFLIFSQIFQNWLLNNREDGCKLRKVDQNGAEFMIAMAARKGLPFFHAINNQVVKMHERGISYRMRTAMVKPFMLERSYVCDSFADSQFVAMGLDNTKYFYSILIAGITTSIIIALLEHCLIIIIKH